MSRINRKNRSWALCVVVVCAAVLVPAAGARVSSQPSAIQPDWTCLGGAPCVMSPWYARDAALRNMQQHQRHEQYVTAQPNTTQPDWTCLGGAPCVMSPWYARDAAVRNAQHQRQLQRAQQQRIHQASSRSIITDTLGGDGGAPLGNNGGAKTPMPA